MHRFDALHKLHKVSVPHPCSPGYGPVDKAGLVDCVCKATFDQIVAVNLLTPSDELRLLIDAEERHNREGGIVGALVIFHAAHVRLFHSDLVRCFRLFDAADSILPDKMRVAVRIIQNRVQRLVVGNLPEADPRTQSAVVLVVHRLKLGKTKHLQVIIIHESKRDGADKGPFSRVLQLLVEVFSNTLFGGRASPGDTVA